MAELQKFNELVLGRPGKVLVKFGAPWCGPCRQVAPILEQMKDEGHDNLYDCNVDEDQTVAVKYGIRNVPTFVVFEDGKEVSRTTGAQTKPALIKLIEG
jgi:thioredoxin 1